MSEWWANCTFPHRNTPTKDETALGFVIVNWRRVGEEEDGNQGGHEVQGLEEEEATQM